MIEGMAHFWTGYTTGVVSMLIVFVIARLAVRRPW